MNVSLHIEIRFRSQSISTATDATFFKASWSKHTNFCQQNIEISQNSGQMAYGQEIQYQVSLLRVHPLVLPFT